MPLVVTQTAAPATEPITTAEAKAHLNITGSSDDTLIDTYTAQARQYVEGFTGRQLVTATWTWSVDGWRDVFRIPFPPVQSVTSIAYIDTDGVSQTVASSVYTLDSVSQPGRVFLAYGQTWPVARTIRNAITFTFVAGFGAAAAVPERYKAAIKMLVHDMYEHRGEMSELTIRENPAVMRLLWLDRVAA